MTLSSTVQIALFFAVLLGCAPPLGKYMARVYSSQTTWMHRVLGGVERQLYRVAGVSEHDEMTWREYAAALLSFSLVGFLVVYVAQRLQGSLPLNPEHVTAVAADSAFNTSLSFVTNTNWQAYAGESTMSYLAQMLALTVQNFASAASGMAVLAALIRGFTRQGTDRIGNFWVDLVRGTLFILLPLSLVLAMALVSQGVVQTFEPYREITLYETRNEAVGMPAATQRLAVGPVASQVAIKQLGTNGGGYFNANSAHPFENPSPLSNWLELLAILLIPAALCHTFGTMVSDRRQGWALLTAMLVILLPVLVATVVAEQRANPSWGSGDVDQQPSAEQSGGNLEGKEVRFGVANSALWAVATTAASNGSVNSMHDSYSPLGGLGPLWLIQLGEVVFGGVGSGLYGMVLFAIVAVFLAGLMVGRTPEYLGKKIGPFEMKMAVVAILLPCTMVLVGTALSVQTDAGRAGIANPGPHGFSEVLYAWSSAGNNNGSAMAGLNANSTFYNGLLGAAMFVGRFGVIIPVLAIAGSVARRKSLPPGPGTLATHSPLFVALLVSVVVIVGALSYLPALALGPIAEAMRDEG